MSQLLTHVQLPSLHLLDDNQSHYLLLDGVKMDPLLKWIYQTFDNPEWYPLYKNTRYHDVIDISPCLVKVSINDPVVEAFVSSMGPKGRAIWLTSPLALESLGQVLSQWLWITTADGGFLHYRFYDPLTLSRFVPHLKPSEREALYRGLSMIIWFDELQGAWRKLSLMPENGPEKNDIEKNSRLNFKREWIDAIINKPSH